MVKNDGHNGQHNDDNSNCDRDEFTSLSPEQTRRRVRGDLHDLVNPWLVRSWNPADHICHLIQQKSGSINKHFRNCGRPDLLEEEAIYDVLEQIPIESRATAIWMLVENLDEYAAAAESAEVST